jgi:hypothetical protein
MLEWDDLRYFLAFVRAGSAQAAAKAAENKFLWDFSDCSVFDFFDSIDPTRTSTARFCCQGLAVLLAKNDGLCGA